MTNFLALDPGDRWIGVAVLQKRRKRWLGESFVIDRQRLSIIQTIRALAPFVSDAHLVICEDYDQRPTGFNAFSSGQTLRLLGAIELSVKLVHKRFALVPPGKPAKALKLWPNARPIFLFSEHREHATSAWRVLGTYLMQKKLYGILTSFTGDSL